MEQQSQNFAPVQPWVALRGLKASEPAVTDHYLVKEIRNKYEELIKRDEKSWRAMICAGEINANFIQGEQILRINHFNGLPTVEKPNLQDPQHIRCINKMRNYNTQWLAKWRSSKPDVFVEALSNQDADVDRAEKANVVVDYLEKSFFNNWFDLHEGMNAQVWGWYGRKVRPDFENRSFPAIREILGEKEFKIGKGTGRCACGYRGGDSKEQTFGKKIIHSCPKCNSLEYDYEPPIAQIQKVKTGEEKVFLPEIVCEPLSFPAVRFDLRHKAEDSPWFINEKRVEKYVVRRMLGNINFPEGEGGNDFGLDVLDSLANKAAESVRAERSDKITLTELYLTSDEMFDIRIGNDEKTVEGGTLPKGKRMSDVFPNGATIIGLNGLGLIIGIYHGCHKDSISSGIYHLKPNSGAGQGIDDVIPVQTQFNRRYSQIDRFMATRGTPPILSPEGAIEPRFKRMLSNPGAVIDVKMQNFPDVRDVRQLLAPLQGESVPGDLLHVTFDRLEDMFQTTYHIMNFAGGNPRADNKTATGAEILDSNSDEIFAPVLSLKADCTVSTVKNGFNKWTQYTPESRYIPYKERQPTGFGIQIKGDDIKGEYNWSYVQGSEAPKNRFTENQKKTNFFMQFGGVGNYLMAKGQFPKEVAELERDFDVNFGGEKGDRISESCRLRLNNAKKMGLPAPQVFMELEPSLLVTEPALKEKAVWFQNLLDSSEGLSMDTATRELVSAFVEVFRKLAEGQSIEVMQSETRVQVAGQAPAQQEQAAQAAVQMQAEAAQKQEQAQAESASQDKQAAAQTISTLAANADSESAREHEADQNESAEALRLVEMLNERDQQAAQHGHEADMAKNEAKRQ